jgi:hypothetical protein
MWVFSLGMANFEKVSDFRIKTQPFELITLHKAKQPYWDKVL